MKVRKNSFPLHHTVCVMAAVSSICLVRVPVQEFILAVIQRLWQMGLTRETNLKHLYAFQNEILRLLIRPTFLFSPKLGYFSSYFCWRTIMPCWLWHYGKKKLTERSRKKSLIWMSSMSGSHWWYRIYLNKKGRAETLQTRLEIDNSDSLLTYGIFKCIFWLDGSFFGGWWSGFSGIRWVKTYQQMAPMSPLNSLTFFCLHICSLCTIVGSIAKRTIKRKSVTYSRRSEARGGSMPESGHCFLLSKSPNEDRNGGGHHHRSRVRTRVVRPAARRAPSCNTRWHAARLFLLLGPFHQQVPCFHVVRCLLQVPTPRAANPWRGERVDDLAARTLVRRRFVDLTPHINGHQRRWSRAVIRPRPTHRLWT